MCKSQPPIGNSFYSVPFPSVRMCFFVFFFWFQIPSPEIQHMVVDKIKINVFSHRSVLCVYGTIAQIWK